MENSIENASLMQILSEITDFRNPNQITYTVAEVLIVVIIGVIAGMKNSLHIGEFAKANKLWFQTKLGLENVPSHDTIDRILTFISYNELEAAFAIWLDDIFKNKHIRKRLKIDGKKIDKNSRNTTTIVRAFLSGLNQVKGAVRIHEYQNEITTIPKLIKKLYIKGYLVSIDAIGTQSDIANLILKQEANYLLPVKKNQKLLYEDLQLYAETEIEDGLKNKNCTVFETYNEGHGRLEKRKCYAFNNIDWIKEFHPKWSHIKSFCLLVSTGQEKNKKAVKTYRVFISNLLLNASEFIYEIRDHWSIENQLHWPLNQSFSENKIFSKSSNFVINFSCILTTALTLIYNLKSNNLSFNLQKLKLSWNLDLILECLYLKV